MLYRLIGLSLQVNSLAGLYLEKKTKFCEIELGQCTRLSLPRALTEPDFAYFFFFPRYKPAKSQFPPINPP